ASSRTATPSLHDALPICSHGPATAKTLLGALVHRRIHPPFRNLSSNGTQDTTPPGRRSSRASTSPKPSRSSSCSETCGISCGRRSEEHTSELQSRENLVC